MRVRGAHHNEQMLVKFLVGDVRQIDFALGEHLNSYTRKMPTSNLAHCALNACQNLELSGFRCHGSHLFKKCCTTCLPMFLASRTNSRTDKGGLGWSAFLSEQNGFCQRNVQQLGLTYAAKTTHVSKIRPTLSFAVIECNGAPMNATPVIFLARTWKAV